MSVYETFFNLCMVEIAVPPPSHDLVHERTLSLDIKLLQKVVILGHFSGQPLLLLPSWLRRH